MSYIQVTELSKEYKVGQNTIKALDKVSFEINEGEFVVILGSSGAGKSTLLNILGGMDLATSGVYKIADDEITSYNLKKLQKYRRNDIGFVFQFYNLIPNLTAYENVLIAEVENGYKAKDVLDMVGLSERLNNFPKALSGGEQQRVSIARAVVKKPKLLLCDEPTGALDSKTGAQIIELLCNMARKEGKTVIVVTHNQALANICDRLIRIKDGKIIENRVIDNPMKVSDVVW
ncbi:TPA: ABC transporter ATP-binding protein [Candidatus Avacholeplasma faecigallinarum]|nr:ABC transporter ATP-binding protein [Candidatus Avacholeplasma faecigallinarum]